VTRPLKNRFNRLPFKCTLAQRYPHEHTVVDSSSKERVNQMSDTLQLVDVTELIQA